MWRDRLNELLCKVAEALHEYRNILRKAWLASLIAGSRIDMAMSDSENSGLWVSKSSIAWSWSVVCGGGEGDCWCTFGGKVCQKGALVLSSGGIKSARASSVASEVLLEVVSVTPSGWSSL